MKVPSLKCSTTVNVPSGLLNTVKCRLTVSVAQSFPQVPGPSDLLAQGPTPLQQRVIRENLQTHFRNGWGVAKGTSVADFISLVRRYQEFRRNVHGSAWFPLCGFR